mmetsp:Transcript_19207/g.50426  ORF Transcript_19207/g.50426 Transcript_19207/m.50426 type:complete len:392 (+) Transcript_19207:853-2028(+)
MGLPVHRPVLLACVARLGVENATANGIGRSRECACSADIILDIDPIRFGADSWATIPASSGRRVDLVRVGEPLWHRRRRPITRRFRSQPLHHRLSRSLQVALEPFGPPPELAPPREPSASGHWEASQLRFHRRHVLGVLLVELFEELGVACVALVARTVRRQGMPPFLEGGPVDREDGRVTSGLALLLGAPRRREEPRRHPCALFLVQRGLALRDLVQQVLHPGHKLEPDGDQLVRAGRLLLWKDGLICRQPLRHPLPVLRPQLRHVAGRPALCDAGDELLGPKPLAHGLLMEQEGAGRWVEARTKHVGTQALEVLEREVGAPRLSKLAEELGLHRAFVRRGPNLVELATPVVGAPRVVLSVLWNQQVFDVPLPELASAQRSHAALAHMHP